MVIAVLIGWIYNNCTCGSDNPGKPQSTRQVRVATKTANLRTGPGTNYDVLTVNADGTGGKLQVKSGTVLHVVGEQNGWYQVRISGDTRKAYIKKSLCGDVKARSGSRKRKGSSSRRTSTSSRSSAAPTAPEAPVAPKAPTAPNEEEVVEIKTNQDSQDDDVFF